MPSQKTAICIPTHGSINALLFEQFLSFAGWCQQQNIPIITVANRTHNDAETGWQLLVVALLIPIN